MLDIFKDSKKAWVAGEESQGPTNRRGQVVQALLCLCKNLKKKPVERGQGDYQRAWNRNAS